MTMNCGFFNARNLDRVYTAENFTDYLSSIICDGIQENYGDCFEVKPGEDGFFTIGTGKAWISGHYCINDTIKNIDISQYVDKALNKYILIGIYCDTSIDVRDCGIEVRAGTASDNPQIPFFQNTETRKYLTIAAVHLNRKATAIHPEDLIDFRNDENLCGYVKCILGKCGVTKLQENFDALSAKVDEYHNELKNIRNDIHLILRLIGFSALPDVNGDGKVNSSDAALILTASANIGAGNPSGLTPEQEKLADVNGDGRLTASDAALVQEYSADVGAGRYDGSLEGWIEFQNAHNLRKTQDSEKIAELEKTLKMVANATNISYPDIDGDGRITATDAARILTASANIGAGNPSGLTPEQEKMADVDGDGRLTASDAALIQEYSACVGAGNYSGDKLGWIKFLSDKGVI